MNKSLHETYVRAETARAGSNRSFGIVIASAFGIITIVNLRRGGVWWPWLGGLSVLFLAAAFFFPSALAVLNRLWFRFGMLLHHIINPVIMGLIFYFAVFPTGLVSRALGKDLLRLNRDPNADSYWIRRSPGPASDTMKDQF